MPSNQPAIPVQQSNPRKIVERVVPAIPLALSKSKSAKPKPKSETVAKDGGAAPAPALHDVHTTTTNGVNGQQRPLQPSTIPNGSGHGHALAATNEESANGTNMLNGSVVMPHTDSLGPRRSAALSLSFGAAPDFSNSHSPSTSNPPAHESPSPLSNSSPASSREMSGRFDGRPMRDALPPAFVPSAEQHTHHQSTSSSQFNQPANFHPHAHPSHPSAGSFVYVSTNSSPARPPPSASPRFASPSRASFPHPQQQYFIQQGYPHQAPDHPHFRAQNPAYGPPGMSWQARPAPYTTVAPQPPYTTPAQPFHHQSHSHPVSYRPGPQDASMPPAAPLMNGHALASRSDSNTSSTALERPNVHQNGQSSSHINHPVQTAGMVSPPKPGATFQGQGNVRPEALPSHLTPPSRFGPHWQRNQPATDADRVAWARLGGHMRSHWAFDAFTDCRLTIRDSTGEGEVNLDAHRVVLAANPKFLRLFAKAQGAKSPSVHVIQLNGPYLRVASFVEALKFFYGCPVPLLEYHRPGSAGSEDHPSNVDCMATAVGYIASGWWLDNGPIGDRGVEVAAGLLHWDTIGTALGFALDGGLGDSFKVEDGSDDRSGVSSSDQSPSRAGEPVVPRPTYGHWSTDFLKRIINFLTSCFPDNFYLDQAAPQFASCPRLPALPNSSKDHSRKPSDPRLSQIRFGEMSSEEDHQRPSFTTTTVSSVLLSLPFAILKSVLENYGIAERLGADTIASIMRQVVAEREARRTKALEAYTASLSSPSLTPLADASSQLVRNLYLEEFVETSNVKPAGFRIARIKRDVDTPPSSEACSEKNNEAGSLN